MRGSSAGRQLGRKWLIPASVTTNLDVNLVLREADVRARMTALGAEAMPMTPSEFDNFMRAEMDDTSKVVKAAGIKLP